MTHQGSVVQVKQLKQGNRFQFFRSSGEPRQVVSPLLLIGDRVSFTVDCPAGRILVDVNCDRIVRVLTIGVAIGLLISQSALAGYVPPSHGGPKRGTGGSGTRSHIAP